MDGTMPGIAIKERLSYFIQRPTIIVLTGLHFTNEEDYTINNISSFQEQDAIGITLKPI